MFYPSIGYPDFNSRTHVECDGCGTYGAKRIIRFQLTHSRGVRRHWCLPTSRTPGISTHALTWSATRRNGDRHSCTRHFNSRTHVECDDSGIFPSAISVYFNSRTHVECDVTGAFQRPGHQGFQLTHSRGVRLGAMAIDILALGISTHALTWSATIPGYSPARFLYISTHALTWSATEENLITLLIIKISTHALTWSATISSTVIIIPHFISTHALTWSATGLEKLIWLITNISTHALTWSATFQRCLRCKIRFISTHALTWSATQKILF